MMEKRLGKLLNRCEALVGGYDKAPLSIVSKYEFFQAENTVGKLVFNVPRTEADFCGRKLNLFLSQRTVSLSSPATETELTFRPSDWAATADKDITGQPASVNATVLISDSMHGAYNARPMNVASVYSRRYGVLWAAYVFGVTAQTDYTLSTAWTSGLVFIKDYWILRGHSMTVEVTPTYSSTTFPATDARIQYRVTGVLAGYKKVMVKQ